MKKIIGLIIAIASVLNSYANEPLARDSVIQANGLSSQQIYESLKKWFITNAKYDSRYIIELDDVNNKHLVGKMNFNFKESSLTWGASSGHISVVIEIMARDGRFKIRLSDFRHVSEHPRFASGWSLGTITTKLPEEWESGFKNKQNREVYKRVFPKCLLISELLFHDIAEYATDFKPIEDEDW